MTTHRINLQELPKLTHDPSSYSPWKREVQVALQYVRCWNTVLGTDTEPARANWATASGTAATARNVRAGSTQPTSTETVTGTGMTEDERKRWEMWAARQDRVQATLKATVSNAILFDIEDMNDAESMWAFCQSLHTLSISENQREVSRKLNLLSLRDDATCEEMASHIETFSQLLMEGKRVGLTNLSTPDGRIHEFRMTILHESYRSIRDYIDNPFIPPTWPGVLTKYNAESARRKALVALGE